LLLCFPSFLLFLWLCLFLLGFKRLGLFLLGDLDWFICRLFVFFLGFFLLLRIFFVFLFRLLLFLDLLSFQWLRRIWFCIVCFIFPFLWLTLWFLRNFLLLFCQNLNIFPRQLNPFKVIMKIFDNNYLLLRFNCTFYSLCKFLNIRSLSSLKDELNPSLIQSFLFISCFEHNNNLLIGQMLRLL